MMITKIKKIMLAVGIGLFSVCTLSQMVDAAPTITGDLKKTDESGNVTYQVTLQEDGENLGIDTLWYSTDGENYTQVPQSSILVWHTNDNNNEVLATVKVSDGVTHLKVLNNATPTPGYDVLAVENVTTTDNAGPVLNWSYKNITDEKYVEFEATDAATKIWKLVDGTGENGAPGKNRVIIEEKEQAQTVVARYDLQGDEEQFYVYDILGNYTPISIEDIDVSYTIAAKDIDGQTVVLNVTLPENSTDISITTVKDVNLVNDTRDPLQYTRVVKTEKGDADDALVAIYTQVPVGTSYLNLTYTHNATQYTIPIELELDIDEPTVVRRNISGNGSVLDIGGTARAYINSDATKAIVEVNDALSGIVKIAACTGTEPIVESNTQNQFVDVSYLPKSVLQLIDLPEGATFIKVIDGVGNVHYIDLNPEKENPDVSVVDDNSALSLTLLGDSAGVVAIFRDSKVGLERFVRATNSAAQEKVITPDDGDVNYMPTTAYTTIQTSSDIAAKYPVTTKTVELNGAAIQGAPEFTIIDAFGNKATKSLNDVLFEKSYIIMDVNNDNTTSIAVKVHDERRIKKITATIDNTETTLELFERGTNATGSGPEDVCKVYEIGKGEVTAVTIYHYNGEVTQNVLTTAENDITSVSQAAADRDDHVKLIENDTDKYVVTIDYGIKKLEYSDGCVIEFYESLPETLDISAKDKNNESLTVVVTDALGYTYTLAHGGEDLTTYA